MSEIRAFADFAVELAHLSGDLIAGYFRKPIDVERKADASPVTIADREAERVLRERIEARFPDHGIIGEEFGNARDGASHVWVLDPIDGTKSFVGGVPLFGTLIALVRDGEPIVGVIHQPILGQLALGTPEGTTLNGEPCRVRPCSSIADATLLVTDREDVGRYQDRARFDALAERARLVRTWGDCYGYFLVATGFADLMCDPIMSPWDIMAVVPVVRGAGGVVTDWHGGDPAKGESLLAAGSAALHAEVLELLRA